MLDTEGQGLSWRERISSTLETKRRLQVSWWRFAIGGWKMKEEYEGSLSELGNLAAGAVRIDMAMKEGNAECGAMIAGQVCGRIGDIPPAGAVVERIVAEAHSIMKSLEDRMIS